VITSLAQFRMGDAWRIGVDPTASTYLVSDGLFAVARNPIFAAMIPAFIGFALLAPNLATIPATILLILGLELQTRLIEEPHMAALHGERYAAYAARTGRFFAGIGRLNTNGEGSISNCPD
jgi:protein-S-isoprenylcysteine O-methyltransferase Ste14